MNLSLIFHSGDYVLISVFFILVLMSIVSWSLIIIRSYSITSALKSNTKVNKLIWESADLTQAVEKISSIDSPYTSLTNYAIESKKKYITNQTSMLQHQVPLTEYLTRAIRNKMSQILHRFDSGLTMLASIGATAPFVGLFGTVWGIYNALIGISESGQISISAVSGPIGEALVATAAGLFVAIPAVLAYNFLVRAKKTLSQNMDGFAHDLHSQLLYTKE